MMPRHQKRFLKKAQSTVNEGQEVGTAKSKPPSPHSPDRYMQINKLRDPFLTCVNSFVTNIDPVKTKVVESSCFIVDR